MIIVVFLLNIFINFSAKGNYATILIYHKFDESKYPTTSISLEIFEEQMKYLKNNDYNVISLSKLIRYIRLKNKIPPKTVVITIDDGYKSTLKAYKILKKYKFPFTVFLYVEGVGRYPDYLTKEQLNELRKDPLVEFGNHSYSHKRFAKLLLNMDIKDYIRLIAKDTLKAEKRLKSLLGFVPKLYAFPYGEYTVPYINTLKEMGYQALLTQDPQNVYEKTPLWLIHRQPIVGSWASMKHFIKVLNTEVLPVIKYSPSIGYLKHNPPEISVVIENLDIYKNCGIYISELGWKKAKRKGNIIYITNIPKLLRWKNRIGITCHNKLTNRTATFFWTIYIKDSK